MLEVVLDALEMLEVFAVCCAVCWRWWRVESFCRRCLSCWRRCAPYAALYAGGGGGWNLFAAGV